MYKIKENTVYIREKYIMKETMLPDEVVDKSLWRTRWEGGIKMANNLRQL